MEIQLDDKIRVNVIIAQIWNDKYDHDGWHSEGKNEDF